MTLSRRALFAAGTATALTAVGGVPAFAADSQFPKEFLTAREDLEGWYPQNLTQIQRDNLRLIIAIGKQLGIPAKGIQVAIATVIVESWVYNRDTVTDQTSGGLFQQQTAYGWGTWDQVRDKVLATRAFFGLADHTNNPGLVDIPNWQDMSIGVAAQAVQRSEFPERYGLHEAEAISLYTTLEPTVTAFTG